METILFSGEKTKVTVSVWLYQRIQDVNLGVLVVCHSISKHKQRMKDQEHLKMRS